MAKLLYSMTETCEATGQSRSTIDRMIRHKRDGFPQPVYIGGRKMVPVLDLHNWIETRVGAGRG